MFKKSECAGQSTFEYIVAVAALAVVTLVPVPGGNGQTAPEMLVEAIKQEYAGYKYAQSSGSL